MRGVEGGTTEIGRGIGTTDLGRGIQGTTETGIAGTTMEAEIGVDARAHLTETGGGIISHLYATTSCRLSDAIRKAVLVASLPRARGGLPARSLPSSSSPQRQPPSPSGPLACHVPEPVRQPVEGELEASDRE